MLLSFSRGFEAFENVIDDGAKVGASAWRPFFPSDVDGGQAGSCQNPGRKSVAEMFIESGNECRCVRGSALQQPPLQRRFACYQPKPSA